MAVVGRGSLTGMKSHSRERVGTQLQMCRSQRNTLSRRKVGVQDRFPTAHLEKPQAKVALDLSGEAPEQNSHPVAGNLKALVTAVVGTAQ